MTREEAIEWMQEEKASFERAPDLNGCPMTEDWQKAIDVYDMAISALRQQEQERKAATGEGLRCKYIVRKADTGEGVDGCFVLRPDRDRAAVAALRAYAAATDNDVLATDILNWVGQESNAPLTMDELRKMDGEPVWCEIYIKGQPSFYGIVHGEKVTGFIPGDDKPANLAITNVGAYGFAWLAYRQKPEEDEAK